MNASDDAPCGVQLRPEEHLGETGTLGAVARHARDPFLRHRAAGRR